MADIKIADVTYVGVDSLIVEKANGTGNLTFILPNTSYNLQSKNVTPTTEQQIITPDNGYYGLSQVVVEAAQGGGATEPYIEETMTSAGYVTSAIMHGYTHIRNYAYTACTTITSIEIPDSITGIGVYAFQQCVGLSSIKISSQPNSTESGALFPAQLQTISANAFYGCTSLRSVRFLGTPITIQTTAFNGCTNLTSIKVPWSQNAVSGAPWGATNATITYNYTGV